MLFTLKLKMCFLIPLEVMCLANVQNLPNPKVLLKDIHSFYKKRKDYLKELILHI